MTSRHRRTNDDEPRRAADRPLSPTSPDRALRRSRLSPASAVLAVGLLLAVAGAAAGGSPAQDRETSQRLARIEDRVLRIESSLQDLRTRLEQIRVQIDNALQPLRVQVADQGEEVRRLRTRLSSLEEQLALTDDRLSDLAAGATTTGAEDERQPSSPMPPPRGPTGMERPTAAGEPADEAPAVDDAYRSAYVDYLKGDYELAISGFREFVRLHPDSERVDNALYWIGESHWARGDYVSALEAFEEIGRDHPDGDAVTDALLKGALSLLELDRVEPAVSRMRRLIEQHPASEPARLACSQLRRLEREVPPECPPPPESGGSR